MSWISNKFKRNPKGDPKEFKRILQEIANRLGLIQDK